MLRHEYIGHFECEITELQIDQRKDEQTRVSRNAYGPSTHFSSPRRLLELGLSDLWSV